MNNRIETCRFIEICGVDVRRFFRQKWLPVIGAIMITFVAGATSIFGAYSGLIKVNLNYDQSTISLISFFKELGGNFGIFTGLLAEVAPPWVILLIGAATNLFGYGMVYRSVMGYQTFEIIPKFWIVCVFIFIGANSQTFLNAAAIITCLKNFPERRSLVWGILKGYGALSGVVITQICMTIYGSDVSNLIFLLVWLPSSVTLVFMCFVRPLIVQNHKNDEVEGFRHLLYYSIIFAVFLMVITMIELQSENPNKAYVGTAITMISMIILPSLFIAIREEIELSHEQCEENPESDEEKNITTRIHSLEFQLRWQSIRNIEDNDETCFGDAFDKPRRGEDYTTLQALLSADMLIILCCAMFGLGSINTAIDNMGQIGDALGYRSETINILVSLISIWNFFGRIFSSFASKALLVNYKVSRPLTLFAVIILSCFGHLFIAFPFCGSLYLSSIILGFSLGAISPLICAIVSEIFGLKYLFTLYNCSLLAAPIGTYALNVHVVGRLYDIEAYMEPENQRSIFNVCRGEQCYGTSFIILIGVALYAAFLSLILVKRTAEFYRVDVYRIYKGEMMYEKFDQDVEQKPVEQKSGGGDSGSDHQVDRKESSIGKGLCSPAVNAAVVVA
ncbi:hypothetical protein UlMin_028966 [Ulmus minor]